MITAPTFFVYYSVFIYYTNYSLFIVFISVQLYQLKPNRKHSIFQIFGRFPQYLTIMKLSSILILWAAGINT